MHMIHITTDARTKMARNLAKFLSERGLVEIKHSIANQAVAAMLGLNEHSLAALIRQPRGVKLLIDESTPQENNRPIPTQNGIAANLAPLESRLGEILASPLIQFDADCRRNLPAQPGVYRILRLSNPNELIAVGEPTLRYVNEST